MGIFWTEIPSRTPEEDHRKAGRSDVNFQRISLPEVVPGILLGTSVLHFKTRSLARSFLRIPQTET